MRSMLQSLAVVAALLTAGTGLGASQVSESDALRVLDEFSAQYRLRKGPFTIGRAQVQLRRKRDHYLYAYHAEPAGILALLRDDVIRERSRWVLHEGQVRPLEYRYIHENSDKNRDAHLVFRWDRREVSNTVQGHTWRMDIPEGTLDKFSVQLAVMLDLARGREPMRYAIADGGRLKTYRFEIVARERVKTPAGVFDTVKIQRLRDTDERITYFWSAPALDYLLVQVEHHDEENGSFSMVLEEFEGRGVSKQTGAKSARARHISATDAPGGRPPG